MKINRTIYSSQDREKLIRELLSMDLELYPVKWEQEFINDLINEFSSYPVKFNGIDGFPDMSFLPGPESYISLLAYMKILQLLYYYNSEWKQDYKNEKTFTYVINLDLSSNKFYIDQCNGDDNLIKFPTQDRAEHFLKHHTGLLKDLYKIS